jgi:hypothetical protein
MCSLLWFVFHRYTFTYCYHHLLGYYWLIVQQQQLTNSKFDSVASAFIILYHRACEREKKHCTVWTLKKLCAELLIQLSECVFRHTGLCCICTNHKSISSNPDPKMHEKKTQIKHNHLPKCPISVIIWEIWWMRCIAMYRLILVLVQGAHLQPWGAGLRPEASSRWMYSSYPANGKQRQSINNRCSEKCRQAQRE